MKILRVASDLYPGVVGGIGIHVDNMSRMQAEAGHDVTIITSDHSRSLPTEEYRNGVEIIRSPEWFNLFGNSFSPGMWRGVARRFSDYDVVHAHSHLYLSTNIAALISNFKNTPLVITNHGFESQTAPKFIQDAYLPTVGKATLDSADCILCYTETDAQKVKNLGVKSKTEIIPNGVDVEKFKPTQIPASKTVLYVGRLTEDKGVKRAVTAFEKIAPDLPEYSLDIIGSGPLEDDLRESTSDRINVVGEIENNQLPKKYNEADLTVLPSSNEGLPRTILESLACATPVVASNLPQLEDVVEQSGILIDPTNMDKLSDAMKYIIENDKEQHKMGETGRKRVIEQYSWKKTVSKTTALFDRII